jgi:predicted TPR repeat methyltransferase
MKKDIYNNQTYLENNPGWHEEDAVFKSDRIEKLLQDHPVHFNTVCEVGCGSGEILVQLRNRFPRVENWVGYDISKDAIAIAKTKSETNLVFALQDIAKVNESEKYDLMLIIDVIEHLENYFSFLDSISSHSRYFIFHIPLDMYVWSLLREGMLIESKKRVGHIHNFTEDFIKSILTDHGFTILHQIYTEPVAKINSVKQKVVDSLRRILFRISPKFCTKTLGGYSLLVLAEKS